MSILTPLKYDAVSASNLTFSVPMTGSYGSGQVVEVRSKGRKVTIQTPKLEVLGCKAWYFSDQETPKRFLALRATPEFAAWMRSIEEAVVAAAHEDPVRSALWFGGGAQDAATVKGWFCETLKDDDIVRFTVPFRSGEATAGLFDAENRPVRFDDAPQTGMAAALIDLEGIWFSNRRFGLRWKLHQVKFYNDAVPNKFAFMEDDA
jgi:hypothetical protein